MGAELHEFEAGDNGQNVGMAYPGPTPYNTGAGAGLFQIIWRGKWLIVLSALVALAGALFYLRHATPVYESTSRILVDKPSPQIRSDVPVPVGSTLTNYLATQASMLTSPVIIAAALSDPNLLALPTFADPGYVHGLLGTLAAEVARKADVIQITASSAHPGDAAQIVNAVVRAYIRWHEANRQLSAADLLKDLNSQLEKRYRELQDKRKEQMLFEQRHPEVVESARGGVVSRTVDLLKQELAMAHLTVVERDSYYEGLQRFEKEPETFRQYVYSHQASAGGAAEEGGRAWYQMELRRAQAELEEVQLPGVAQRARITMLQNRLAELQKQIAESDATFVQQHLALAKTLSQDAHAREKQLAALYEKEFSKVQNLGEHDSQYALLKSEGEIMEKLCNSLLNQISQLDLSARLEGLRIHVLAKAVPATVPSSPQRARVLGIGLVLGLMVGTGLSLLRDWRDQRVRSADEITALLEMPVLGAIPSVGRRALARDQKLRFAANSRESEACRAIRTTLLCGAHRDQARTILVTSPGPREGKTLLVSNLGAVMAQLGQKTLIIDADLRKPIEERVFTTNGHSLGLVDVLAGGADLQQAIRPMDPDGLYVLEGGRRTTNPSELLNSPAFAALLQQLRGEYDRILIDSPPVGMVTDAQILATLCGATLLVLRAEKSSRLLAQRARDALLAVGVRIAGAVVNDVPRRSGQFSQYGGYGYCGSPQGANDHSETGAATPMAADPAMESGVLPPSGRGRSAETVRQETAVDADRSIEIRAVTPKKNDRGAVRKDPAQDGDPEPGDGDQAEDGKKGQGGR